MKLRYSAPALVLALALAGQPLLAQAHRGGGSGGGHGGGSHGGSHGSHGGSAVPRGTGHGGGMHYGSGPGYGYRYNSGHGHYGGSHGYYRPYYGYGYRPYYSYYPYYSPYYSYWPGVSLSFGWGYGSSWPYYLGGGYYGGPAYSASVYPAYGAGVSDDGERPRPPARDSERSYGDRSGRVRLEVRPDDASVYVDDEFRGTAREARIMNLPPGRHVIELVRPGFAIERRAVSVVTGESRDVLVELLRP